VRAAPALAALLLLGGALAARAAEIADLLQGTNLTFALAPNGATLVVDLAGQLWRVPAAGGGAEPLTAPGEEARNPRYSPDGTRVVYQRFEADQWDLWLLDLGTAEQRRLTTTPADERDPEFTADGGSILFASNRTGRFCIWSLNLEDGVETQLTEEPGDASFPTASDFGPVAYVLDRGTQSELRALLQSGVSTLLASSTQRLAAPSWRPGGGVVVFSERDGSAGSRLQMLVLGDPQVKKPLSGPEDLFHARPAWLSAAEFVYAADGQLWRRGIAMQSRRPVHLFAARAVEIQLPPADLPKLDELGPRLARGIASSATSADGRRTAFTALGDLWLLERGELRQLTNDAYVDLDPAFTPDGESVVFASERSGQLELWRIPLRGGAPAQVTFGALQPRRPAVSGDGRRVAFLETDGLGPWSPAKMMLADLGRAGETTTVATGLLAAERPTWGADGRTLGVRLARTDSVLAPASSDSALRIEIATPTEPGPEQPSAQRTDTRNDASPRPIELRWTPAQPPGDYVVEVGRLFDGVRGDYRRHVDIHVRAGRIAAIVPRGTLPTPASVRDARDATVIPGLIDVHVHQSALAGERLGRAWLAYGVTTVREIATDVAEAVERGESWANGRPPGPRLIVSPAAGVAAPTDAAAPSAVPVRSYPGIADGLGHSLLRQQRKLALPALGGRFQRRETLALGSGAHYELELSPELASYQDSIGTLIASRTVLPPALGSLTGLASWPDSELGSRNRDPAYSALFTPSERSAWAAAGPAAGASARLEQTVARLIRGGGQVAIGSDAPAVPYGLGVHYELAMLAAAGIPNDQVLRLATAEGALALGLEQQLGTLEEGKLADFVVLDGDPLTRLIDTLKIVAVSKGGRWLDRQELLEAPP
jgi:Tol biopolymer transport system component